jgi:hypothetical protein
MHQASLVLPRPKEQRQHQSRDFRAKSQRDAGSKQQKIW